MRRCMVLLIVLCAFVPACLAAQAVTSTRAVREADRRTVPALGDTVTIAGRATLGWGVLDSTDLNIYVQDADGGVFVDADGSPLRLQAGDSVVVTGVIEAQRGVRRLEDATVRHVPVKRASPAPFRLGTARPDALAAAGDRLVTLEGRVLEAHLGRGDRLLVIGESRATGHHVRVVDPARSVPVLRFDRFSVGDRVRVTGVMTQRTAARTGIVRYMVYPRRAGDLAAVGLSAQNRARLAATTGVLATLFALTLVVRTIRRKRARTYARAANELREHAAKYRALIDQAPVGIVVHRDGRIVVANRVFRSLVGTMDPDGVSLVDLVPAAEREGLTDAFRGPTEGSPGATATQTHRLTRADGSVVHVDIVNGAISYEGTPCVQSVVCDVSERKRAEDALVESEAALRQAQKLDAVGQLAAGVAHDFNNILTAIKCNAEFLGDGCPACRATFAEAGEINDAADRAAALTSQLLTFSRKQPSRPDVVKPDRIIENLEPMLRRLVPAHVEQRIELTAPDGFVRADPVQLEQVVVNLAVNAMDAMPLGGVLSIRTSVVLLTASTAPGGMAPGAYLKLVVSDTGCGMDEQTRAHAFEPFFTTKEQGKGTGLGLSTVYGIVTQSGGHIILRSAPGAGTTFEIFFQSVEGVASDAASAPDTAVPAAANETVLLVEDEHSIRRIIARTLERNGYTVLAAESGLDALAMVRSHPGTIDLLLTDVVLPGLSGDEIAAHLRKGRPGLSVLFMSGYAGDRLSDLASQRDLLQKPFTPAQLMLQVREALARDALIA